MSPLRADLPCPASKAQDLNDYVLRLLLGGQSRWPPLISSEGLASLQGGRPHCLIAKAAFMSRALYDPANLLYGSLHLDTMIQSQTERVCDTSSAPVAFVSFAGVIHQPHPSP